ncbi:alpha-hydroxy acid oxidase [Microvirga lotononidis]|uniref:Alpha-hydroxyacid dehydrogenase, FMN-dependent L-lactate dehydrogenase n=1 Tax=Microvirga lotononidis TaxID=864069 RepID=I4YN62_9HYPH|nr:alpha-hydroxy acid oxidase [Microvirga lotononidis]EIM25404.1 alpha-hydroxyacid dehydrogenase, FMN-dependent L-lactate dehydrogenase [Microvirga lotononidis]WQO27300.1 alpha-hydroxy acid oxidase [Microvirga lotononidis]
MGTSDTPRGVERSTTDLESTPVKGIVRTPPTALPRRLRRILALDDFEIAAQRHLPRPIFGYVSGAAETNTSLRDNRSAFREFGFVPRVLVDVSKRTQKVELLGHTYAAPFGIAPMGISALSAYRGDLVLARAARRANIPMVMSGSSLIRLEEVAKANPAAWFQAYLPGEPDRILGLLERVERAGFETLVLTVDTAVLANRENNVRSGFSTPLRPSLRLAWDGMIRPNWTLNTFLRTLLKHGMPHFENSYATRGAPILAKSVMRDFGAKDHLNWRHLELIRERWNGRLVVKGIMAKEDACIARDSGVDGIVVSNHGGRQLDGTVSPLRVLPAIADAVGASIPVMMDGGIRRGSDVLKAIALGASFVFVGRPFVYAAAIGGEAGVSHAVNILSSEISRNMGLLGISALGEMRPDRLLKLNGVSEDQT